MPLTKSTRELLHNKEFRLLYGGYLASAVTDGFIPIVFTIEVLRISSSPWALSMVLIALMLGRFLVVPLSGRLAATRHPLAVMIGADTIRITAQAGLVVVIILSSNSAAAMVVSAFLYGVGVGVYMPAQKTALPALVSPTGLEKANATFSMATDVSLIAGPALGVAVTHLLGFSGALALDCLTFAINIAALLRLIAVCRAQRINLQADTAARATEDGTAMSAGGTIRIAWRLARTDSFLGSSLAFWTCTSVLIGMVAVYAPSRIIDSTGGAGTWAAIATVMAVSSLAGSVSAAVGTRLPYRFGVLAVATLLISQIVAVALEMHSGSVAAYFTYAVFGAGALMTTWSGIQWTSAVQRRLHRADLGRFFAVESALTAIGIPVGMALAPVLELASGLWLLAILGVALLAAAVIVARTPTRSLEYATT
ncbi:MFS transporter [Mycobacterium sp.]|uniref:MFS transporter n=1 Tax=Mycobacterium sp. TaxID=1785 RepID=UPI002D8F4127|nr:MFS transporter [Mycobacterium sp.]